MKTEVLYIRHINLYNNDLSSVYGFHRIKFIEQFNVNRLVVTTYRLPATKLNGRGLNLK